MRRRALLLLLSLASCRSTAPSAGSDSFVDRHLATLPQDADPAWTVAFSPEGRQVAYVAKTPKGSWVVRGEWSSRPFEAICCLAISDDGKRVAFLGGDGKGEVVSLDDHRLAFPGAGWHPVWPLIFSADGAVVAYALSHEKERQARMVVTGREHPVFDYVGQPSLSRDGRVVAYRAIRHDENFIRIGDRDEPSCLEITDPVVSADGSTVAYAGKSAEGWFLQAGVRRTPLAGKPAKVFLSPDGRQAGWVQIEDLPTGGSKMRVVAFGKTGPAFGLVGHPAFSPTEDVVAYAAEEEKRSFVVIGARKIETPYRVSDPVFSPDGRKVGYGARIGRELWWKVLDVATHR